MSDTLLLWVKDHYPQVKEILSSPTQHVFDISELPDDQINPLWNDIHNKLMDLY